MHMNIDERQLTELIVESQDLQVDALRGVKETFPALEERREAIRREGLDPSLQIALGNFAVSMV